LNAVCITIIAKKINVLKGRTLLPAFFVTKESALISYMPKFLEYLQALCLR